MFQCGVVEGGGIPSEQMDAFITAFWDEKLELDKAFWKEIAPLREKYNDQLNQAMLDSYKQYKADGKDAGQVQTKGEKKK